MANRAPVLLAESTVVNTSRFRLLLLVCYVLTGLFSSLQAGEIRTIDGANHIGEITSLDSSEVKLRSGEGDKITSFPLKEVISIDWNNAARNVTRVPYLKVKLIDGTLVYCLTLEMKAKQIELLLINGHRWTVTFDQVHAIVCDAQDTASLAAFEALEAERPKEDVIRVQSREGNNIEPYQGLIQEANAQGTRLVFKAVGLDQASNIDVARLRGLYFHRSNVGVGPQAIARIYDAFGNCFTATAWQWGKSDCTLTTQLGKQLVLPNSTITKMDLTPGKLVYLSDLEPLKVEESPILADLFRYRKDKNLEGGPLSVGRRIYEKGLALHSRTILEYDIKGYSSFRCTLGLDDAMAGSAHALVRIEGDDKVLLSTNINSRENKPQQVNVDIKGLQKLRIVVDYGEDLDLGDHINLADARLIK